MTSRRGFLAALAGLVPAAWLGGKVKGEVGPQGMSEYAPIRKVGRSSSGADLYGYRDNGYEKIVDEKWHPDGSVTFTFYRFKSKWHADNGIY